MKIYDVIGIGASLTGSFSGSFKGLFTGPLDGVAATSSYVEYTDVANKPALVSGSSQVLAFNVFTTTGSNQFNGNQSITGSLTVSGQVIAQTLNVQQVTSSIVFSSGSNRFGNNSGNTHQFTGSVNITGSLSATSVRIAAAGTANPTIFRNTSGTTSSTSNSNVIGFNSVNNIFVSTQNSGGFILGFNNSVQNREYTLPDASGTVALTTNLSSYLPLSGGTLTGALNGTSASFTGVLTLTNGTTSTNQNALGFAFNRNISNGAIFSNTGFAYQWQRTMSTTAASDILELQLYNPSGAYVNSPITFNGTGAATFSGALNGTSASFSSNMVVGSGSTTTSKLTILATTGVAAPGSPTLGIYDTSAPTFGFDFSLEGVATGDLYLNRLVSGTRTSVLQIARATGAATFSNNVNISGDIQLNSTFGTVKTSANNSVLILLANPSLVDNETRIELVGRTYESVGNSIYYRAATHIFTDSAAATERMRITSNGLTFNGDTAAANALDDYEEGTWTPSVGGNATYHADNYGRYTKIGNVVTCQFRIAISTIGTGSTFSLSGFPFASANILNIQTGHVSYWADLGVNTIYLSFYIENDATTALFVGKSSSGSIVDNGITLFKNGAQVAGHIIYRTA